MISSPFLWISRPFCSKETAAKRLTFPLSKVYRLSRPYLGSTEPDSKETSVSKNPPHGVSRITRRLFASGSCRLPEEETDYRVHSASPDVTSNAYTRAQTHQHRGGRKCTHRKQYSLALGRALVHALADMYMWTQISLYTPPRGRVRVITTKSGPRLTGNGLR